MVLLFQTQEVSTPEMVKMHTIGVIHRVDSYRDLSSGEEDNAHKEG